MTRAADPAAPVLESDVPKGSPRTRLGVAILLAALPGCTCESRAALPSADRSDGAIPEVDAAFLEEEATIDVDGRLDEPAWQRAGSTGPFVRPQDGLPEPGSAVNASARVAWDERALYVGMVVHDADPSSPFARDAEDPHIWERASGVELMLQPGDPADNRHYYEVQVDVAGAVWDTRFDDYNRPITDGTGGRRFGHQGWSSALERAVHVDSDAGTYTVEMAVPWSAVPSDRTAVPPAAGDIWRVNLYAFRDGQRDAMAWSPLLGEGNFHRTARFGRVRFRR